MKKLLFILSYVLVSNVSIAQMHGTQFCTGADSTNWGGGWFCNQDSFNFYDHSFGPIVSYSWIFRDADDSLLSYTTFQPVVSAHWSTPGWHRVILATLDTFGVTVTQNVGIHLSFAHVQLNYDTVALAVGDSVQLVATGTSGGYYRWQQNGGAWSTYSPTNTTFMAHDTGIVVVEIGAVGGSCQETDVVRIVQPSITTGISQTTNEAHFALYPNPATEQIVVESGKTDTYKILDVTGQTVLSGKIVGREVIDIRELHTGIYFFVSGNSARKFIVQH